MTHRFLLVESPEELSDALSRLPPLVSTSERNPENKRPVNPIAGAAVLSPLHNQIKIILTDPSPPGGQSARRRPTPSLAGANLKLQVHTFGPVSAENMFSLCNFQQNVINSLQLRVNDRMLEVTDSVIAESALTDNNEAVFHSRSLSESPTGSSLLEMYVRGGLQSVSEHTRFESKMVSEVQ